MKSNYRRLGELIKRIDKRNSLNLELELKGVSINKKFISSVANINGTDLKRYKVVNDKQFAANLMHVDRDKIVPVAMWDSEQEVIVSPAYDVFEVKALDDLIPEYLMLCFNMPLFDRNAWFLSGSSIRGNLTWESFCDIMIPVPSKQKQKTLVNMLQTIEKNIGQSKLVVDLLRDFSRLLYSKLFKEYYYNNFSNTLYHNRTGEIIEIDIKELPEDRSLNKLEDVAEQVKLPVKSGKHIFDKKYVPIDLIPKFKLVLDNYISGRNAKSSLISFNKGDVLLGAMRVYFHRVSFASFDGITRSTVFVLRPVENFDLATILMILDDDETISYATKNSRGTTMPYTVWKDGLANYKIVLPPVNTRAKFNSDIRKVLDYSTFQINKIHKLEQIKTEIYKSLSTIQ